MRRSPSPPHGVISRICYSISPTPTTLVLAKAYIPRLLSIRKLMTWPSRFAPTATRDALHCGTHLPCLHRLSGRGRQLHMGSLANTDMEHTGDLVPFLALLEERTDSHTSQQTGGRQAPRTPLPLPPPTLPSPPPPHWHDSGRWRMAAFPRPHLPTYYTTHLLPLPASPTYYLLAWLCQAMEGHHSQPGRTALEGRAWRTEIFGGRGGRAGDHAT